MLSATYLVGDRITKDLHRRRGQVDCSGAKGAAEHPMSRWKILGVSALGVVSFRRLTLLSPQDARRHRRVSTNMRLTEGRDAATTSPSSPGCVQKFGVRSASHGIAPCLAPCLQCRPKPSSSIRSRNGRTVGRREPMVSRRRRSRSGGRSRSHAPGVDDSGFAEQCEALFS